MDMHVVIVGGGFGGVHAALKLANKHGIHVRLVTSETYFEYHAALYRSATGRSPLEVAIPLAQFFRFAKNVEIVQDTVESINPHGHVTGRSGSVYRYDQLVLATGSVTAYFGIRGVQQYAYGAKTIQEALRFKRHLHEQLLRSEVEHAYVVVGGGATGVELAAELVSYLKRVRRKHRVQPGYTVYLVEANDRVLSILPQSMSKAVERRLERIGVKLVLGTAIQSETADYLELPAGNIRSHTVVWTAGMANNPLLTESGHFKLGRAGKVEVGEFLEALPNVYVVGDSAATRFSGMAQTALHNAAFVASDILRKQSGQQRQSYKPKQPVYAIPVGPRWSAVRWGWLEVYGRVGWLLRRLADLRLYVTFLPPYKALRTWRYGYVDEEACPVCRV